MLGSSDGQRRIFRAMCAELYSADNGRPGIPPEQLFLALPGGCLLGCRSERNIIRQLTCDMAFRWFVGLDLDSPVWDPSTFSKNRERRFDGAGHLRKAFRRGGVGGAGAGISTGKAERDGAVALLDRAKSRYGLEARGSGADEGCFVKTFAQDLLDRKIAPHPAALKTGRDKALMRVRMRQRGPTYQLSQRARKKIGEPWGEGKGLHGLRRFSRRTLEHAQPQAIRRPPGRH